MLNQRLESELARSESRNKNQKDNRKITTLHRLCDFSRVLYVKTSYGHGGGVSSLCVQSHPVRMGIREGVGGGFY